jgi:hypothetical protein
MISKHDLQSSEWISQQLKTKIFISITTTHVANLNNSQHLSEDEI